MTFEQAQLSLQLMAEERLGAPIRNEARIARAREDAAFESAKAQMT